MAARKTPLGPNGECDDCRQPHARDGRVTCGGHVVNDRDSYVPGQPRKPLDEPRPCRKFPSTGLTVCDSHGAENPVAKEAGKQRDAEAKAEAALLRKLGDSGTPITDPIGTLCSIAGRAVKLMELIGETLDDPAVDEARFARYERSLSRAATVVESLIRMGIAERLAKVDEQFTASIVAFIDGVLSDLGHDPRSPEVAGVVAARLELVS